jgi:hypothetical protein
LVDLRWEQVFPSSVDPRWEWVLALLSNRPLLEELVASVVYLLAGPVSLPLVFLQLVLPLSELPVAVLLSAE